MLQIILPCFFQGFNASGFVCRICLSVFEYSFDFAEIFTCAKISTGSMTPRSQFYIYDSYTFGPKINGLQHFYVEVQCFEDFLGIFLNMPADLAELLTPRRQTFYFLVRFGGPGWLVKKIVR